jgi:hypothetical protein
VNTATTATSTQNNSRAPCLVSCIDPTRPMGVLPTIRAGNLRTMGSPDLVTHAADGAMIVTTTPPARAF